MFWQSAGGFFKRIAVVKTKSKLIEVKDDFFSASDKAYSEKRISECSQQEWNLWSSD